VVLATRRRRLSTRLFRKALQPFDVEVDGQALPVKPGDFVDAELVRSLPGRGRGLLGPSATIRQVTRAVGFRPPDEQWIVRPEATPEPAMLPARAPVPKPSADEDVIGRLIVGTGLHRDEDVIAPLGWVLTAAILRAAAERSGADIVYPAHNLAEPCSLPMNGDAGSSLGRMPGGLSTFEIARGLAGRDFTPIDARPHRPGVAYITPEAREKLDAGADVRTLRHVTTPRAFVWRDRDEAGSTAALVGSKGRSGTWADVAPQARLAASEGTYGRPPVALYSTAIGPWGGVYVLFRVADELQRLGVHANVVYSADVPHHYRPQTAPLKVPNSNVLANDWPRLIGEGAILVASHWGSGFRVADVVGKNPDVILTSILQDREDLFVSPRGKSLAHDVRDQYLAIGRGASVSRWILDSAQRDLGTDVSDYRVIHAGLDLDTFNPGAGERLPAEGRPVRVLAMWRPQTNDRRGGALLHVVYRHLAERYGRSRVSLEVFGFDDPASPPPAGVKHHGILKPADVAKLMAEVDVVVEPSQYQGFGLPAAEAAACGACVVSTTNLGIDEWGIHEVNALVVPHADLPEAVCRAIDDGRLRRRLAKAGTKAVEKFGWTNVGRQWASYLADLYLTERPDGPWAEQWARIAEAARVG